MCKHTGPSLHVVKGLIDGVELCKVTSQMHIVLQPNPSDRFSSYFLLKKKMPVGRKEQC